MFAACPEPDILVNNNGGPPPTAFVDLTREMILAGLEANMLTPIALIQRALPGMAARRFGRIVNITSSSVGADRRPRRLVGRARRPDRLRRRQRARLRQANVTINSIQPGAFDTDRIRVTLAKAAASGEDAAALRARREAAIPAGRFGRPEEFGALCAFLASASAGLLTGQNILIDGGAFPGAF